MRLRSLVGVFLGLILCASTLLGQPDGFRRGDVVVTAHMVIDDPFNRHATVDLYDANGALRKNLVSEAGNYLGGATFRNGILYVVLGGAVRSVGFDGMQSIVAGPTNAAADVVATSDGSFYVGSLITPEVRHFSPSGVLLKVLQIPGARTAANIDLDADGCTLFYLQDNVLGRFNVCTELALSPVRTDMDAGSGNDLSILPGGDLLTSDRSGLRRIARSGSVLRTYSQPIGKFALTESADAIWGATETSLSKIDLASGATVGIPTLFRYTSVHSVAVLGGWRAALTTSIPTLSVWALVVLATALLAIGFAFQRSTF